jgi:hypothetical protein
MKCTPIFDPLSTPRVEAAGAMQFDPINQFLALGFALSRTQQTRRA